MLTCKSKPEKAALQLLLRPNLQLGMGQHGQPLIVYPWNGAQAWLQHVTQPHLQVANTRLRSQRHGAALSTRKVHMDFHGRQRIRPPPLRPMCFSFGLPFKPTQHGAPSKMTHPAITAVKLLAKQNRAALPTVDGIDCRSSQSNSPSAPQTLTITRKPTREDSDSLPIRALNWNHVPLLTGMVYKQNAMHSIETSPTGSPRNLPQPKP